MPNTAQTWIKNYTLIKKLKETAMTNFIHYWATCQIDMQHVTQSTSNFHSEFDHSQSRGILANLLVDTHISL